MSTETSTAATAPSGDVVSEDLPVRRGPSAAVMAGILLAVCLWVLWRTGPGKVPGYENFENIARNWPTIEMGPETAYVLRVPLGQALYAAFPSHGTGRFLALHLATLVLSALILVAWLCRRLGLRAGLVATAIMALAPITAVLLLWIGMYDAFSILAWVLVLVSLGRAGPWQFAAGVVAGFQNFEQVMVGLLLLALIPRLAKAAGVRPRIAFLLAGAVTGKVLLEAYLGSVGATPGGRLTYLSDGDVLSHLLGTSAANGGQILWSALAGLWAFALTALVISWGSFSTREKAGLVVAALVWFGSNLVSADHTRVLTMTSFPVVVLGAMVIADRYRDLPALARMPQAWMLLLAPPVVIFDYVTVPMGIKPYLWGYWVF